MLLKFILNGQPAEVSDPPGDITLLALLRDYLGLKGTKEGCGVGECGACTVLLDGKAVNACLTAAWQAAGRSVTTIEGMAQGDRLHPLQAAFVERGAVQCGFCTPGMIMSASSLLAEDPDPSPEKIKTALVGNFCRCTGYGQIVEAVQTAAREMKGRRS